MLCSEGNRVIMDTIPLHARVTRPLGLSEARLASLEADIGAVILSLSPSQAHLTYLALTNNIFTSPLSSTLQPQPSTSPSLAVQGG